MVKHLVSKKGFTIIEVSLVLAVAGMIMLAIFVALPAVQRTERDAERQEDLAEIIRGLKNYQSNNRGALPKDRSAWISFYGNYLGDLADPNGQKYFDDSMSLVECGGATGEACSARSTVIANFMNGDFAANNYKMVVVTQATCKESQAVKSANIRKVALLYTLEGSGVVCKNS